MKPRAARKAMIVVAAVFALGALLPAWLGGSRASEGKARAEAPSAVAAADVG